MKQCFRERNKVQGRSVIQIEVRRASPHIHPGFLLGSVFKTKVPYAEANANRELSKRNRSEFGGAKAAGICGSGY